MLCWVFIANRRGCRLSWTEVSAMVVLWAKKSAKKLHWMAGDPTVLESIRLG